MDELTFAHHPRGKWEFDPERTYTQDPVRPMKPHGLWLSVDDDWRRWCEGEEWGLPLADPVFFDVDASRCLTLSTPEDLDSFTEIWKSQDWNNNRFGSVHYINWAGVASRYAGIIIAPYQWSRRLEHNTSWYYGWDCASACIWDLSAVSLLNALEDA